MLTLTLLSFLVVLLVGLATYTRVETAVAGSMQRQTQARENALLALNVALGQLQKHAGPDQRVTATGQAFGDSDAKKLAMKNLTGVWDATGTGTTPLTWLVSGSENADATPDDILAAAPDPTSNATGDQEFLVGDRTVSARADRVKVAKQNITAVGVPGQTGSVRIGRYAWWVGDQGVKASVAMPDTSSSVTFPPYNSADLRSRIRQQIALGAGAADTSGNPVFEPRDNNNASLVAGEKVLSLAQIGFLKNASNSQLGLTRVMQNFHTWSPDNSAVLANSKNGGLRQDLSLKPDLLGAGFVAWANYDAQNGGYMEDPLNPSVPVPEPAYGSDPVRRRYLMQPPMSADGAYHSVTPVLSYFLLSFNVRTEPASSSSNVGSAKLGPVQARARYGVSFWNPYSSAMVPENLRLEITGLGQPNDYQLVDETDPTLSSPFSLQSVFDDGGAIRIDLPWNPSGSSRYDCQSWLPGRVYSWVSVEKKDGVAGPNGFESEFYSRDINGVGKQGIQRLINIPPVVGADSCYLTSDSCMLEIKLFAVRPDGDVLLKTFTSPQFDALTTTSGALSDETYTVTYLFRLRENAGWLTTQGVDFRQGAPSADIFEAVSNGFDPAVNPNFVTFSAQDKLLDRATDEFAYDGDTPVFELPRAPILSLGVLQHLPVDGQRPFAIGNSWGAGSQLNAVPSSELFDRFFFSGLEVGITPSTVGGALLLPNPLLKVLRNPSTAAATTLTDLRDAPDARSSKFLLQGRAFNLNSTNTAAWAAVLRGVRFPAPQTFSYLNAAFTTGTSSDSSKLTLQSSDAKFFRFSQSAQETYKATTIPVNGSTWAASIVPPPDPADPNTANNAPDPISQANTYLFRQGVKSLTAAQVGALATKITDAIKARHAATGPFRSLEDFLGPSLSGSSSLLEQAIIDADADGSLINTDSSGITIEFSSQFLTQADIMTALAPVLFPRSDTFMIRTYGEVVNPATSATEGRAWCEAIVQRVPEYLDAAADAPEVLPDALVSELNKIHGRRFKVISFRWLTRSDI